MSARSARSASEIPPESPHPRALAVTNYINADGTSRAIAVFTARLRAPCPAGIPPRRHQRRRGRRLRGRRNMAGPRGGTAGLLGTKAANHRHHAENPQPRPRPPIRHRLRGSCIPSLSFFFRLSSSAVVLSSLSTPVALFYLHPLLFFPSLCSRVSTRNHGASRRFSSRSRGNLQITIMEEHLSFHLSLSLEEASRPRCYSRAESPKKKSRLGAVA